MANGDGDVIPHNQRAYIPFSSGFGVCPGKHLALQNIKYAFDSYPLKHRKVVKSETN